MLGAFAWAARPTEALLIRTAAFEIPVRIESHYNPLLHASNKTGTRPGGFPSKAKASIPTYLDRLIWGFQTKCSTRFETKVTFDQSPHSCWQNLIAMHLKPDPKASSMHLKNT